MPFKVNIGTQDGKTFKVETESEELLGKVIGDKIAGNVISGDLEGYEFEIMGTSDQAGFPGFSEVEGPNLKRLLLTYGKGMHKRPKFEGKKKRSNPRPKGLRLKKTVRGTEISRETIQINLKIVKQGGKKLQEIFPDQNKKEEPKPEGGEQGQAPATEAPKAEEKKE